jgi:RNA polymerase sigma-70 factor (ECF subfamily)
MNESLLMNSDVVDWVTSNFLPFEAELRRMLRRVCAGPAEIDDVVQETYYKVLMLPAVDHIREPNAFLVRTAKNLVMDRMRRDAIVSMEAMANLDDLEIADEAPSIERVVLARAELNWVMGLIANLPRRCKAVVMARRIDGLSQFETARSLGVSEGIVEKEMTRGMELISDIVAQVGMGSGAQFQASAPAATATLPGKRRFGKLS